MKKTFYVNLLMITLFTGLLISCSKEKITEQDTSFMNASISMKLSDQNDQNGSIAGLIISNSAKYSILLYGKTKTMGPFFINPDGTFKIEKIPAGTYKLVISWSDPNTGITDNEIQISTYSLQVIVEPGRTTNLTPIFL